YSTAGIKRVTTRCEIRQDVPALLLTAERHREDRLHKATAPVTLGPVTAPAPQHRVPEAPFCGIVRCSTPSTRGKVHKAGFRTINSTLLPAVLAPQQRAPRATSS